MEFLVSPTSVTLTAAGTPQSPPHVILSGARTSRSEVLAESKDPYSLLPLHDCVQAFSLCMRLQR
jgi:hypothetical protein